MTVEKTPALSRLRSAFDGAARRLTGSSGAPPEAYQYNYTHVPPLPLVDQLPEPEKPALRWYVKAIIQSMRVTRNRMNWAAAPAGDAGAITGPLAFTDDEEPAEIDLSHLDLGAVSCDDLPTDDEIEALLDRAEAGDSPDEPLSLGEEDESVAATVTDALRVAARVMHMGITNPLQLYAVISKATGQPPAGRPTSIDDYRRLFTSLPLPWPAERFGDDAAFAWLRVAGANPLVLARVERLDASFPVSDADLARGLGDPGDSLALAGAEGRLFLADYVELAGVENGTSPYGPKYCYAPKALFALPRGKGPRRLAPIAIQCGQDPAENPVFTPADGDAWLAAKIIVEIADGNHHEMISHFGRTHLLMSPFVIATCRRLPFDHPLSRLLRPHFEGTLAINNNALSTLIAPGHEVDKSLGGTIEASRKLAVDALKEPYFNVAFLPDALAARGVMSPDLEYPYRDDALLVWQAIERWIRSYVGLFYADDAAVAADAALAAWGAEIVADDGGRLLGFGERDDGTITTVSYLVKALTLIVFTASAQHAAVNNPQASILVCTLSAPFAGYRPAPRTKDEALKMSFLDLLPPMEMALLQAEFLSLLGGVVHTRLGDYDDAFFATPAVRPLVTAFRGELRKIQRAIEERNRTRFAPYPFMSPEQITQSINI